MKTAYENVRVRHPVKRPGAKKGPKVFSEKFRQARALAVAVSDEISGFSPLEKKAVALIEAKNNNKARKLLKKRLGSHKRAVVKVERLAKMLLEE